MDAWTRIERWLAEHVPEIAADLNPPATEEEIRSAEHALSQRLPDDVKALYRHHDGQGEDAAGVFFGLPLLPLHRVVGAWESWIDVVDPATSEELSAQARSAPEGAIQLLYTCSGWIPLSDDCGGNHFGVDLAPGPSGTHGQVIHFGRDELDKHVLADSLEDFVVKIGDLLWEGNVVIADGGLSLKEPAAKHLLDAAAFLAERAARRLQ